MDILLILLAIGLLVGFHSVLHGLLRPIARRAFPPPPGVPAAQTPSPEARAASRRRWDRFLLVLTALLIVGVFLQIFVL
ncbi:hypothetical protein [Silanimonas lenta]|jgi:hypothetical protein|uniref:hypothetical protein n=1 Tax=Silanimonas lenta TaxID=265429 RepID=UPI0021DC4419|nr:MAG: hypothetical protein KatS3mg128_0082 [Silanimonas sp.]